MECLVQQFRGEVENSNMELFDQVGVTLQSANESSYLDILYADWMDGNIIKADKPLYIGYSGVKADAVLTDVYVIPNTGRKHFYFWPADLNTDVTIYLPKRHLLEYLQRYNGANITISSFDTLRDMYALATFNPCGASVDYDLIKSNVLTTIGPDVLLGSGSKITLQDVSDAIVTIDVQKDVVLGLLNGLADKTSLATLKINKAAASGNVSGSIVYLPLDSLEYAILSNNKNISGSIEHFNTSTKIKQLWLNNCNKVTGSINNLPITLESVEVYNTGCTGDIKTLADNQVAAGRTSGTLRVMSSGNIKNNGTAYTGNKTITFSGGSYVIS